MLKAEARRLAKNRVASMSEEERLRADRAICSAVESFEAFRNCKMPFVYISVEGEPSTAQIISRRLKAVCAPKLEGRQMRAVIITEDTKFVDNAYGIPEPMSGREAEDIDVAIVPMVAFDGLNRLGHGGGYYDAFFAKSPGIFKLGIAYDAACADFDIEAHDVALDAVITEMRIISKDSRGIVDICANPFWQALRKI